MDRYMDIWTRIVDFVPEVVAYIEQTQKNGYCYEVHRFI